MNKIHTVLTERWSISDAAYSSLMLALLSALKTGNIEAAERQLDMNPVKAFGIQPSQPNVARNWELDDENLPMDSVAVITMEGPLYSWETFRLEGYLQAAIENSKVIGIVLWINGPGGMAAHVDLVAKMVEECPKPIATYVAFMMASAHFWIGTAAQRIFIASPMCNVGCVGTMTQYFSLSGLYEKLGIDARDIYPDEADLKNYEFRQLHDHGNEEPIKTKLSKTNQLFCQAVSRQLGIAYDPDSELFRGKMFDGDEAMEMGIADQIGTLQDAVMWVFTKAVVARTK